MQVFLKNKIFKKMKPVVSKQARKWEVAAQLMAAA